MSVIYPYNLQTIASIVFNVIFWGLYKALFMHLVLLKMLLEKKEEKKKSCLEFQGPLWSF